MPVYILDPCAYSVSGHNPVWMEVFARQIEALGYSPLMVANRKYPHENLGAYGVLRELTAMQFHFTAEHDLLQVWDAYHQFTAKMKTDLEQLFAGNEAGGRTIGRDDILVFPTVYEFQLMGILEWMLGLAERDRPFVVIGLMGPSGVVEKPGGGDFDLHSRDTARFYKLAFREAKKLRDRVSFLCLGDQFARQYSFLRGAPVAAYPPLQPSIHLGDKLRPDATRTVQLYAGTVRGNKGANILGRLARLCCATFPDWTFRIHLGATEAERTNNRAFIVNIAGLTDRFANIEVSTEVLDTEQYAALYRDAEIFVLPYSPRVYFNQSSGTLWEGIAAASTVIVPDNCWISQEAEALGADYVCFDAQSAESVFGAIKTAIETPAMSRRQKISAAHQFRERSDTAKLRGLLQNAFEHAHTSSSFSRAS